MQVITVGQLSGPDSRLCRRYVVHIKKRFGRRMISVAGTARGCYYGIDQLFSIDMRRVVCRCEMRRRPPFPSHTTGYYLVYGQKKPATKHGRAIVWHSFVVATCCVRDACNTGHTKRHFNRGPVIGRKARMRTGAVESLPWGARLVIRITGYIVSLRVLGTTGGQSGAFLFQAPLHHSANNSARRSC